MFKLLPIVIAVLYGWIYFKFSVLQTNRDLAEKSRVLDDPKLRPVFDRLARALDLPQVRVHLYDIEPVNGLAAPDGKIYITRGFLKKFKSGDVSDGEIASVIAHELGHVALQHSRRRMIDFGAQNAARTVLMGVLGRFVPFVGPIIANTLINLLVARLSRKDEFEADAYATALMIKAGFGTAPQISLFKKLETLVGSGSSAPAWLLSHPKSDERIAAIRANEAKWTANIKA